MTFLLVVGGVIVFIVYSMLLVYLAQAVAYTGSRVDRLNKDIVNITTILTVLRRNSHRHVNSASINAPIVRENEGPKEVGPTSYERIMEDQADD